MMKCHYETLYGNFLQRSFVETNYTVNKKRTFNHGTYQFKKKKLRKLLLFKLVHLTKYTKDFIIWRLFAEPYLGQFSTNHVQTDLLLIDLLN